MGGEKNGAAIENLEVVSVGPIETSEYRSRDLVLRTGAHELRVELIEWKPDWIGVVKKNKALLKLSKEHEHAQEQTLKKEKAVLEDLENSPQLEMLKSDNSKSGAQRLVFVCCALVLCFHSL